MSTTRQVAHYQRADEPSEISDGIDQSNRSSGCGLAEEKSRHCPEARLEAVESPASHHKQKNRYGQVGTIDHREGESDATNENGHCRMPSAFASSVGVPSIQLLRDESCYVRQSGKQRHLQIASPREMFENGRQPERDAVTPGHGAEVAKGQQNYIAVTKGFPNAVRANAFLGLLFSPQFGSNPGLFIGGKPSCFFRPVREIKNGKDSEK